MALKPPHVLLAGRNPRQVKDNLTGILDQAALQLIEGAIHANVALLYSLGSQQYSFARRLHARHWRQVVSRAYYGAYNVSRAIRLQVHGEFSTEVRDHQKFESLPDDFPKKHTYSNLLTTLRDDRNLCDYDHTAMETDLVIGRSAALTLVRDFISDAKGYLVTLGLTL